MGEFKNRINVTINDQHYTIVGEDNPEHSICCTSSG